MGSRDPSRRRRAIKALHIQQVQKDKKPAGHAPQRPPSTQPSRTDQVCRAQRWSSRWAAKASKGSTNKKKIRSPKRPKHYSRNSCSALIVRKQKKTFKNEPCQCRRSQGGGAASHDGARRRARDSRNCRLQWKRKKKLTTVDKRTSFDKTEQRRLRYTSLDEANVHQKERD